jgi:hypothetical protein
VGEVEQRDDRGARAKTAASSARPTPGNASTGRRRTLIPQSVPSGAFAAVAALTAARGGDAAHGDDPQVPREDDLDHPAAER